MSLHDCLEFIPTLAKYGAAHSIGQTNRQEPCIARIQNYSDNEWTNEWQISKNKKVTNKAPHQQILEVHGAFRIQMALFHY
jgi:peptidyl-tRNA hydrolase